MAVVGEFEGYRLVRLLFWVRFYSEIDGGGAILVVRAISDVTVVVVGTVTVVWVT